MMKLRYIIKSIVQRLLSFCCTSTKALLVYVAWKKETMMKKEAARVLESETKPDEGTGQDYKKLPSGPAAVQEEEVFLLQNIYWKELSLLVYVWIGFLVVQVAKEYTTTCFIAYWILTSLQVVYLPVAFLKDWLCNVLKRHSSKSSKDAQSVTESSSVLNSPIALKFFEMELQGTFARKDSEVDLSSHEEGRPLVPKLKHGVQKQLTTREIATFGFYIAPVWFVIEGQVNYSMGIQRKRNLICWLHLNHLFWLFLPRRKHQFFSRIDGSRVLILVLKLTIVEGLEVILMDKGRSQSMIKLMRQTFGIFTVGGALGFWVLCRLHYGPRLTVPRSLRWAAVGAVSVSSTTTLLVRLFSSKCEPENIAVYDSGRRST